MGGQNDDRPQFARSGGSTDVVELRGDCPGSIVQVLDAVSLARGISRTALVNEVLGRWADKVRHEASLVARIAGLNPPQPEAERRP